MNGESAAWDPALIDLFRSEVETHAESLNNALLALERSAGDTSQLDQMMRAAHSIKGASRVVGVDPAVRVAHAMEDCFVAAQKGTVRLSPPDVDVLLRAVDLLGKISTATRDPQSNLAEAFGEAVDAVVRELEATLAGRPQAVSPGQAASELTISFPAILDSASAEQIRRQILSAADSPCQTILFDLSATKDLDVQGLALLAAAPRHLAKHSRASLRLAGISDELAMVLRVTGLSAQFGLRGSSV